MYTLYGAATPHGRKASIMLEETGLPYRIHLVDFAAGEHLADDYRRISPIGKIPALVDPDLDGASQRIFGSGAILLHLAEKSGLLLPGGGPRRAEALSWLAFGISDLAPAATELFRFSVRAPERQPYTIDVFRAELYRFYDAMAAQLGQTEYLATEYGIADIACFPFVAMAAALKPEFFPRFPALKLWHDRCAARPAVARGMQALA
jgi:GST-like protein